MRILAGVVVTVLVLGGCSSGASGGNSARGANSVSGTSAAPAAVAGPQGGWRVAYTGYGQVSEGGNGRSFFLEPARAESTTSTHAALVLSARSWDDFTLVVRVRTASQLRRPRPNEWEVGWVLWHYADDQHFYYVILKPNGFELGKEDPSSPGHQRFLVTGNEPTFPVGRWYAVRISQRGDVISVSVDGRSLVRYADTRDPYGSGLIGLYTEDAAVTYQVVDFTPDP
jgi:hypothetical protein